MAPSPKAIALGAIVVLVVLGAAWFTVRRMDTYPVTAVAVTTPPGTAGLEVVATLPAKLVPSTLVGKNVTLSFAIPSSTGAPVSVSSTIYAVIDSTGAYTGPAPQKTALPTPPPAGSAIIQFVAPPAASLSAFPASATLYSALTSGATIRIS